MLGALLLPLPFAALPITAVLFSAAPAATNDGLVVQTPLPLEQPLEAVASAELPDGVPGDATMAYGVTSQPDGACGDYRPAAEG
jgi:hypothetical protein